MVANRLRLVREIFGERPVQGWHLTVDLPDLAERLSSEYSAIVDGICLQRTQALAGAAWADKTPEYILHLEQIHRLFPESKFIHVVRDGRDVAVSLFDKPWGPSNILTAAQYWKLCNHSTDLQTQLADQGLYLRVRYEDLLSEPEKTLVAVYDFLNLEKDDVAIKAVCEPVRRDNTGHWRHVLSTREVRLFEQLTGNILRQQGYETTFAEKPVNPPTSSHLQVSPTAQYLLATLLYQRH